MELNILAVATVMMPEHNHYGGWMWKLVELQLSAYAMPEDTRKQSRWMVWC